MPRRYGARMDQSTLDTWAEDNLAADFSGVIAVARGGDVVAHRLRGYANRADAIPNALDTRFAIASGSKLFTAVAICQLVDAGRLTLDTRLRTFTTEGGLDERITVRHLLTHTSGIASYFDEDDEYGQVWHDVPMYRMRRPHDYLPLFVDKPAVFAPGERFEYNDAGFVLLGLIVEELTGRPFADHVRDSVFAPAGMTDSGYFESDRLPARTAQGYLDDGRTNVFEVPVVGGGDGGAYVTAPDLARFWVTLTAGNLLSPAMTRELLAPATATGDDAPHSHYGLGVWKAGDAWSFVEGGDPGACMISGYFPGAERGDDLTMTVIANIETPLWKAFKALPAVASRASHT